MSAPVTITGTGLWVPSERITNDELVGSYNTYSEAGRRRGDDLQPSDAAFIERASGVKGRYVVDREGILDPERMRPKIRARSPEETSLQCEVAVHAAQQALNSSGRDPTTIDTVIAACSNFQRPYPAVAIEVQAALGASGFAFDLNVACASAVMALQIAQDAIRAGSASRVLVVNPEFCSAHLNFRDRDSHFIFGDACTAFLVEAYSDDLPSGSFLVRSTSLRTKFSNNIRNDGGFLSRAEDRDPDDPALLFRQQGRKVFREVAPLVAKHIGAHLDREGISVNGVRRFWLHQANAVMNRYIARKLFGREPEEHEAPLVLDDFANTSSAGSVIAFHRYSADFEPGELGVLCAFGAGYSIGSAVLQRGPR